MRLRRSRSSQPVKLSPGDRAPAVVGTDPGGDAIELEPGSDRIVLYFLTSSCRSCQPVWAALAQGQAGVAVTPDAATEDRRKLEKLAAGTATVVMSSQAWFQYGAGPAPWRVVIDDGVIVSSGPA